MRLVHSLWLSAILILIAGCASYPINPSIDQVNESKGYRFANLALGEKNTDELFVVVSLSGGGTRAMALDYGVLSYLDTLHIDNGRRTLLDEVDIISSSSAASIVNAYYGLYGKDAFLTRFRNDVLSKNMERALKRRVLNPLQWPRLWSGTFSRGDLAAEYFDKEIFDGHTFSDMQAARPMVIVNATDMGIGSQFPFVQGKFDALCSDLSRFSVARAVAASLAFTPGFTPITLKNYDKTLCGYTTPDWVQAALEAGVESNALVYAQARDFVSYEHTERRPYIHLLDSGIADNIGIRIPGLVFAVRDTPWSQADRLLDGTIRRLVVIIVDARPKRDFKGDLKPKPPGAATSVRVAATSPLANYSYETVDLVRKSMKNLAKDTESYDKKRAACTSHAANICAQRSNRNKCRREVTGSCFQAFRVTDADRPPNLDLYMVHVSFESVDDGSRRRRLQTIPTTLQLPKEDVDLLIESAPELVNQAPDFQRLMRDLAARVVH
ncbi:MAG: patatin-like phospholipase family protein [Gammaproteobacteria bacterium]|jgi:NTE family protein|nr:patatin-like phospholipase family protein [Gammaproteobacteria bacterium]